MIHSDNDFKELLDQLKIEKKLRDDFHCKCRKCQLLSLTKDEIEIVLAALEIVVEQNLIKMNFHKALDTLNKKINK